MHYYRLNARLEGVEGQYNISHRWEPTDRDYVQIQMSLSTEKENYIAESMWATSARRKFLLRLKAKYAGILTYNNTSTIYALL